MSEIVVAVLGSGVLSAIISGIFGIVNRFLIKESAETQALKLLMLSDIKREGKEHIVECKITMDELEAFSDRYRIYKELGGDGWADEIYAKVKSLPIK